jgi:hypothetical protein
MAFVAAVENGTRDELVGEIRIIVFPESDATEVTTSFVHIGAAGVSVARFC